MSKQPSQHALKIGEAAKILGVSVKTLRRWEQAKKIKSRRTPGGTRFYSINALKKVNPALRHLYQEEIKTNHLPSTEPHQNISIDTETLLKKAGENSLLKESEIKIFETVTYPDSPTKASKSSLFTKFLISSASMLALTLAITSWITASYLFQSKPTTQMTQANSAGMLSPFNFLAEEIVNIISPQKARELGLSKPEPPPPVAYNLLPVTSSNVLAETASSPYLEINGDTQINGSLVVQNSINGLTVEATPSANTLALSSGSTTLTITNNALLDQDVSTTSSPTFAGINLTGTTLVGRNTTDTLTNKSMSGSSNTFTNIPASALTDAKITVTAGTNLSGGGDVNLGSSVTLALKDSPSLTGTLTVAGATTLSSTLAVTGASTLSSTLAVTGVTTIADGTVAAPGLAFTSDTDSGLYRIGANKIGLITAGTATSGITIDGNGNVGIGTASPVARLHNAGGTLFGTLAVTDKASGGAIGTATATVDIYTSIALNQTTSGQTITLPDPTNTTAGRIVYISNTGSASFTFLNSAVQSNTTTAALWNGTQWTLAGGGGLTPGTTNNSTLRWNTATTQWVENGNVLSTSTGTMGLNGNLGVGTTGNPDYNLKVLGTGFFSGFVGIGSSLNVSGNVGIGNSLTVTSGVSFSSSLNVSGNTNLTTLNATDINSSTLTTTGNIGVGSSLTVTSGANFSSSVNVTGNTNLSTLNTSGNVGIGSSLTVTSGVNLLSSLKVTGLTSLAGLNATDINSSTLTTTGNVGVGASLTVTSGANFSSSVNISGNTNLNTVNISGLSRINNMFTTGNVGIGATTSSNKLDVWGNARIAGALTVDGDFTLGGSNTGSQFLAKDGTALAPGYSFQDDRDVGLWRIGTNQLALTTNGQIESGLSINSSGNVGIATTNPVQKFQVNPSGTAAVVINASGNLGIGNTSPASPIDITPSLTTGTIFNMAYAPTTTLTGSLTGWSLDLNSGNVVPSNNSVTGAQITLPTTTTTSGSSTLKGLVVNFGSGSGINNNSAGSLTYTAADLSMPALTQTQGTLTANGVLITTPSSITTGGTANAINVSATGVGAGALNGVNIGTITGGAGTETALNIGTGWDVALKVGSTTVINGSGVTQVAGGGTGIASYNIGDLLYASATGTLTNLGVGTSGQVLTTTAGVPTWSTINGSSCVTCLINNPTATSVNTISPTGQATTGLSVRQTSTANPTQDIFNVTSSDGATKYFYVDKDGNVSAGSQSSTTITLTPTSDTTALTLVGTNVTTAKLAYFNSHNTQGTIFDISYGSSQTLTGTLTGQAIDFTNLGIGASNQSVTGQAITLPAITNTHTSGTKTYNGLSVTTASGINQNGAGGATTSNAISVTIPPLTQTAGTITGNGILITTPTSITTGGTANGLNISASGIGAGTLTGVNIGAISAGAGTEVALTIGSGWDTLISNANFFVKGDGNLGIGTSNPTRALDVVGIGNISGNLGIGGTATVTSLAILNGGVSLAGNLNQSSGVILVPNGSATAPAYSFTSSTNTGLWSPSANALSLTTNGSGTSGLTVTAAGNVGIGITAPSGKLGIKMAGGEVFFADGTSNSPRLTSTTDALEVVAGYTLRLQSGTTAARDMEFYTGTSSRFVFNQGSIASPIEVMRIETNGNVGIGATTSDNKLDVWGNARIAGTGTIDSTLTVGGVATLQASNGALSFTGATPSITSGGSVLGLFAGGNVGIGTTGNLYGGLTVRGAGTGTNIALQTYGANLTQGLTVLDNGNVGIGTTNPLTNLEITNATANPYLAVTKSGGLAGIILADAVTDPKAKFEVNTNTGQIIIGGVHSNYYSSLYAGNSEVVRITTGGNVGIGVTSPTQALELAGTMLFRPTASSGQKGCIQFNTTNGDLEYSNDCSTFQSFGATAGGWSDQGTYTRLTTTSANVGIGVSGPPDRKLQLANDIDLTSSIASLLGTNGTQFAITGGSGTGGTEKKLVLGIDTTDNYGVIQAGNTSGTAYNLSLQPGGGNVGIGTASPVQTFQVNSTTSSFVVDSTGNVGIGTSAPYSALANRELTLSAGLSGNVTTALNFAGNRTGANQALSYLNFKTALGDVARIVVNVGAGGNDSSDILFQTSTGGPSLSTRMVIDRNGNVGIGFSSPDRVLQVASAPSAATSLANILGANGSQLSLTGNAAGTTLTKLAIGMDTTNNFGYLQAGQNGTASNLILEPFGGNVGIGTTSPTDLSGNAATFLELQGGAAGSELFLNTTSTSTGQVAGALAFAVSTTTGSEKRSAIIRSSKTGDAATSITGDLEFFTTNANTISEKMRITAAGGLYMAGATGTDKGAGTINATGLFVNGVAVATGGSTQWYTATGGIAYSNNVGIGTSTPVGLLQVGSTVARNMSVSAAANVTMKLNNNALQTMLTLENTQIDAADFGDAILFRLGYGGDSSATAGTIVNGGQIAVASEQTWTSTAATQDSYMTFSNTLNGTMTEHMRIDSNGNVGIGFTSPGVLLDVVGVAATTPTIRIRAQGSRYDADMIMDSSQLSANDDASHIRFQNSGNEKAQIATFMDGATDAMGIWFKTTATGGSETERLRITSTGNVGIANASPTHTLDITGTLNVSGAVTCGSGCSSGPWTTSGSYLYQTSYNVGIGTATPLKILHVGAGAYTPTIVANGLTVQNAGATALTVADATNSIEAEIWSGVIGTRNVVRMGAATSSELELATGNTARMTITSGGNVGIGFSGPNQALQVASAPSAATSLANILGANGSQLSLTGSTATTLLTKLAIGMDTTNNFGYLQAGQNGAASNLILEPSGGNVGIGTTSPTTKLSIQPTVYTSATDGIKFQSSDNSINNIIQPVKVANGTMNLWIGANEYVNTSGNLARFDTGTANASIDIRSDNGQIQFYTGTSGGTAGQVAVIDSAGNLGIGTASPGAHLDVHPATADAFMQLKADNTYDSTFTLDTGRLDYSMLYYAYRGTTEWTIGQYAGDITTKLAIYQSNTTPMITFTSGGGTQIGAPTGGDKGVGFLNAQGLYVNGVAVATGGSTQWYTATGGIAYSNNVGIGTSTPNDMLEVSKSQNATTEIRVTNATNGTAALAGLYLVRDNTAGLNIQALSAGFTTSGLAIANSARLQTDSGLTGGMVLNVAGAGPMIFGTNNAEKMRIDSAGNVGIGFTSPIATLQVHTAAGSNPSFKLSDGDFANPFSTLESTNVAVNFTPVSSTLGGLAILGYSGDTNAIVMRGLMGSASPSVANAAIEFRAGKLSGSTGTALASTETAYNFSDWNNTTKYLTIMGSGNIGIGISSPNQNLNLAGTFGIRQTQSDTNQGCIKYNSSTLQLQWSNDCLAYQPFSASAAGGWTYDSINNVTRLTTNSSNVGIGFTSPGSTLSVNGGATIGSLYASSAAPSNGLLIAGSVGIGSTTPGVIPGANKFQVLGGTAVFGGGAFPTASYGQVGPRVGILHNDGNDGGLIIGDMQDGTAAGRGGWLVLGARRTSGKNDFAPTEIVGARESATSANASTYMSFHTSDSNENLREHMRIDSAGMVGIGTSVPNSFGRPTGDQILSISAAKNGAYADRNAAILQMTGLTNTGLQSSAPVWMLFNVSEAGTIKNLGEIYVDSSESTNSNGRMGFQVASSGTLTNRLLIDATGVKVTSGYSGGTVGALDYAELYPATEDMDKGDVVVIDPNTTTSVKKSTGAYASSIVGIVSTSPASVIEGDQVHFAGIDYQHNPRKPAVALSGRVPVKVSTENGSIEAGDYLTSSSIPGVAMKATRPGPTVGKALESYAGEGIGKIMVFVNVSYADPFQALGTFSLDSNGSLTQTGNLTLTGNLGIGTTTPQARLQVTGDSGQLLNISNSTSSLFNVSSNGNVGIGTSNPQFTLEINGTGKLNDAGWTYASDLRLKENISQIGSALDIIEGLNPVTFDYIDGGKNRSGFIAQEVQGVLPNLVTTGSDGMLGIRLEELIPYTVKAIQEQQSQLSAISQQLSDIKVSTDGVLEVPEIKAGKITLSAGLSINSADIDLLSSLNAISTAILGVQSQEATTSAKIDTLATKVDSQAEKLASLEEKLASLSAQMQVTGYRQQATENGQLTGDRVQESTLSATATASATEASASSTVAYSLLPDASLDLTPPDVLLATASAQLVNLTVTSEATISGQLTAYNLNIQDGLKSLGKTTLSDTSIMGSLTMDGNLTIENGSEINTIGTLYLQKSSFGSSVDFFNGLVTIDNLGQVKAVSIQTQQLVMSPEILGESKIAVGTTEVTIKTPAVSNKARIFVTPQVEITTPLFVTDKITGQSFKVKIKEPAASEIIFDWTIIESP